MPSVENANIILQSLQRAGIEVVASLPDAFLVHVLEGLDSSNEFLHLPVTREEEGIGICTGAYLGGKRTCMVMQNAGLAAGPAVAGFVITGEGYGMLGWMGIGLYGVSMILILPLAMSLGEG